MDKRKMILDLIKHYTDGNKRQFAMKVGTTAQNINGWITRGNFDPELIYSKCEHLSAQWLLTGEGEMILSQDPPIAHRALNPGEGIPLIPVSAAAGMLQGETSVMEYECERYIVPEFRDADFLIRVKGTSMTPTYMPGDIVACRKVSMSSIFFQWNHVYVLDTDQGIIIKRIRQAEKDSFIYIASDNEEYPPFQLSLHYIYGVAIVIGLIRLE